jgi:hypothetical protein
VFAHRVVTNGNGSYTRKKSELSEQAIREIVDNVAVPI